MITTGGEHRHEDHQRTVYIGLVGALSVVGFFFFEKLVNVLGKIKNKNKTVISSLISVAGLES